MVQSINNFISGAVLIAALLIMGALPASASNPASYPAGSMANGIANTRHNLGGTGRVLITGATTEICVFCHTPHHGTTNAPLWNKGIQSTTYSAYGTTVAGTYVSDSDIGGATLACLSCHDGVNAFDTLVNAPGKGNGGANNTTAINNFWGWQMPPATTNINNPFFDHFRATGLVAPGNSCESCHNSALSGNFASGGTGNPSNRLAVGTDLSNDHPVSVRYQINKASLRPTSTVISDIQMTMAGFSATDNDETDSTTTTANRWAVAGYINTGATIADLLRGSDNRVECSSCHDPHFDNLSWDEVESTWGPPAISQIDPPYWCSSGEDCTDGNFLRRIGGNSLSGVCRTCHAK